MEVSRGSAICQQSQEVEKLAAMFVNWDIEYGVYKNTLLLDMAHS